MLAGLCEDADRIDVALFPYSELGSSVWWSFDDVWRMVSHKHTKSTASQVWHEKMARWKDMEEELLFEGHLRSAQPIAKGVADFGCRVLPFHSVSTHMLVSLVARMAIGIANVGGLRDALSAKAAHKVLQGVLSAAFGKGRTAFNFFLYVEAEWAPSTFSWRAQRLRLHPRRWQVG